MTDATELQRFPLGRHARRPIEQRNTPTERADYVQRLANQSALLAAAVDGLEDDDWQQPYRPGGWTLQQLVHHIADSHSNALIRLKLALTEDRPTIKPYDQDAWVLLADCALAPHISLMQFMAVQTRLVAVLQSLDAAAFERRLVHPESGEMSVDQLIALYAWHGDHHIAQIEAYKAARG